MNRLMPLLSVLSLAACNSRTATVTPAVSPRLRHDVVAYATASCFASLPDPFLKTQGERWAGAVIQRGHGAVEPWTALGQAVATELKRGGIAQAQGDGPKASTMPLPVMTCGEIAATPAVRTGLAAAERALAADYAFNPAP